MAIRNDRVFWIDLPNPQQTTVDDAWINIAQTKTREQAEEILKNRYGINKKDSRLFITQGN